MAWKLAARRFGSRRHQMEFSSVQTWFGRRPLHWCRSVLFISKAQENGYHPEIILAGRRLNDSMGEYVASQIGQVDD